MQKPRIIHIHTDVKFIHSSNSFDNEEFDNTIIIIGSRGRYKGVHKDSAIYYNYSRGDFHKVIKLCQFASMVVLYDLNFPKAYIVNRLPKSVKVVWRFFGTELYSRIPEYVYSEKTLQILKLGKERNRYLTIRKNVIDYLSIIKYWAIPTKEINKAIFCRTDFFLGLSKPEHEFLKTIWKNLPPFLQSDIPAYLQNANTEVKKSNLIILGNNRRHYNNHLDIIERINQSENKYNFNFLLVFNYGANDRYTEIVRNHARKVKEIQILEDFLSLQKFKDVYIGADAFVMNGYRQMALGNILEAFHNNVKLYLNEKNIIYTWLKENGFLVFTIEDFFADLESNNITLSPRDGIVNKKQLIKFTERYNKDLFKNLIKEILKMETQ